MNESDITTRLLDHLRTALRPPQTTTSAVITKLADRSTGGLPDSVVTFEGRTYWLEIKYQRPGARLRDLIGMLQLTYDHLLNVASDNRCWIVMFSEGATAKWLTIWHPAALFALIYPQLAGPDKWKNCAGFRPRHFITITNVNKFSLMTFGAIRFDDWPFEVIEHLIRNDLHTIEDAPRRGWAHTHSPETERTKNQLLGRDDPFSHVNLARLEDQQ